VSLPYSQAREAGCSPRESSDGAPCAPSSSTLTASGFLCSARTRAFLTRFQSGPTCEPLTGHPGVDAWISYLRDSRARRTARRAAAVWSGQISSTKSSESFLRFGLGPSYLRTYWHVPIRPSSGRGCNTAVPPAWVPAITESDIGWLPTPTTRNNQSSPSMMKWPAYVRLAKLFGARRPSLVFWEWMMGWPIGWTDTAPLATDRFLSWLRAYGLERGHDVNSTLPPLADRIDALHKQAAAMRFGK
jgi:hypothetical protein